LSQAISIRKALSTGLLRSDQAATHVAIDYDYKDIKLRLIRAIKADREWQSFFYNNAITPVNCLYERLSKTPQLAVDRIARSIGLPSGAPIDPDRLRLKVQRDASSAAWRDRFIEEARTKDPELQRYCDERFARDIL
jgi:trehalose 2-sulfotransferase